MMLTRSFFDVIEHFHVFISTVTVAELERTPDDSLRSQMRRAIARFDVLQPNDQVERLARQYVRLGAIPASHREDAYHIALAVTSGVDYLLSWNFNHIVRRRTRDTVRFVSARSGLRDIEISTPAELL
jgi:predicted nucleic acid-binding protein